MTSPTELLIVGAGAQAKYVLEICALLGDMLVLGLVDVADNPVIWGKPRFGTHVLGGLEVLAQWSRTGGAAIVCTGDNLHKQQLTEQVTRLGYQLVNRIHPRAVIATTAQIGEGTIINAGAVVQPYARLGRGVMIHAGVVVEHDDHIEDYVNLAPGVRLAGWVTVKQRAYVYTGASVIPSKTIGADAQVGAGAVVINDVPDRAVVVGVPARIVKYLDLG